MNMYRPDLDPTQTAVRESREKAPCKSVAHLLSKVVGSLAADVCGSPNRVAKTEKVDTARSFRGHFLDLSGEEIPDVVVALSREN